MNIRSNAHMIRAFGMRNTDPVASATGWDLSTATYTGASLAVGGDPQGLIVDPTVSRISHGDTGTDAIEQFTLTTPGDLSAGATGGAALSIVTESRDPTGLAYNADGTKGFMITKWDDEIIRYSLATPYDFASSTGIDYQDATLGNAVDIAFNADGTSMYVTEENNTRIAKYDLSIAYDTTTRGALQSAFTLVASKFTIDLKPDESKVYVARNGVDEVLEITMSTPGDLSTGTITFTLDVSAQTNLKITGIAFSASGKLMYLLDRGSDTVYEYSVGPA